MPSFLSELLLAFLFVTVGFIGGAAVVMFWNERRNPSPSDSAPTRSAAAPQNTQPTAGQPAVEPSAPSPAASAAAPRGVHLWADAERGLQVELHGQPCESAQSLPLEDRQRMTALAGEWLRWLGAPLPKAPTPTPGTAPMPAAPQPAAPAVPAAAEPAKPGLSLNPLKGLMPAKKPAEPEVKAAPASIAGQIDEILQEILEKAPEGTPAVRLMDDPREGVVVWVGAQKFLGVDTLTDPLARKLVQTAVAEWERRNSGVKS